MRKRSQRLWMIGAAAILVAGAIGLAVTALRETVSFFYSPSDLVEKNAIADGRSARVGGLVEVGSEGHNSDGALVFRITDNKHTVPVVFDGIPPDLFQEGQGVVAEGRFDADGRLVANRVLAKHDENYMPKEVYDALRKDAEGAAAREPTS